MLSFDLNKCMHFFNTFIIIMNQTNAILIKTVEQYQIHIAIQTILFFLLYSFTIYCGAFVSQNFEKQQFQLIFSDIYSLYHHEIMTLSNYNQFRTYQMINNSENKSESLLPLSQTPNFDNFVLPQYTDDQSKKILDIVIAQLKVAKMGIPYTQIEQQWNIFIKKFNTKSKLLLLRDPNHRQLIIKLIGLGQMKLYNYSYFNRSKIDKNHLKYFDEMGPYLFVEAVMIISKLKIIHKYYNEQFSKYQDDNSIQSIIKNLLETCNEKGRKVNNNSKKFLIIVEHEEYRLNLIRQLGKLLRQAWKKDKDKTVKNYQEPGVDLGFLSEKQQLFDDKSSLSRVQMLNQEQSQQSCNFI